MNTGRTFYRLCKASFPCLLTLLFCAVSAPAFSSNNPVEEGKKLFNSKCTPCHTVGGGRKVGPDLRGVTVDHPKNWLFSFISDPESKFRENDPVATAMLKEYQMKMPNLGLSPDEVNAVISYLETESKAAPPAKAAPVVQPSASGQTPVADVGQGKEYFVGETRFKNSGPPCMACHSVPGIKYLGGGNLGPDLTNVYASLGNGIASVLVKVPFPTMKPIFDNHPLTPEEAQDLAAFLQSNDSRQPETYTTRVIVVSLIAFVILMIIGLIVWRNRLVSVRKALVEHATREEDQR